MSPIKIVAGLGNPGKEYELTRHNAGFWFVEALARELGASFKKESKFHGEVAKAGGVWLVKPTTFMNKSGLAVGSLAKFYQVTPEEVLVVHDEMDLPAGSAKMKTGGAAGNNGVKDIVAKSVGTSNPHNMIKATFAALQLLNSPRMVATRRGKKVGDLLGRRDDTVVEAAA